MLPKSALVRRCFIPLVVGALLAGACGSDNPESAPPTSTNPSTTSAPTTSTSTTSTSTTSVPATAPTTTQPPPLTAAELCAAALVEPRPVVASAGLPEISGIVASRLHPGLIWAHNDSGGEPQLHLISDDGSDLGTWRFGDAIAFDWEDMAVGQLSDGSSALFAADMGDNFSIRSDVRILRVREPTDLLDHESLDVTSFVLTFPEGAQDAEALFIDPVTDEIVIITKGRDNDPIRIYTYPADATDQLTGELTLVGEVNLDGASPLTTAASITADGSVIAIRTYAEVLLWDRPTGATLSEALSAAPCRATAEPEVQGEAISFLPNGDGYVTISEGLNPLVNIFIAP